MGGESGAAAGRASGSGGTSGAGAAGAGKGGAPLSIAPVGGGGPEAHRCVNDHARRIIRGGFDEVRGTALSEDGSVIYINDVPADVAEDSIWRWSEGSEALELVLSTRAARARMASADGSTLLGEDDTGDFLWRDRTVVRLPFDRHPWDCLPRLSRDGGSVVGCLGRRAVIVRDATTTVIEPPSGFEATLPLAINVDGTAVAGLAYTIGADGVAAESDAMIWTVRGGSPRTQVLGPGRAVAISDDGSRAIVIGPMTGGALYQTRAYRWSEDGTSEILGRWSYAVGTPDLSIVAGAEERLLHHWTESSGVSSYGAVVWNVLKVVQLSLDGERAIVEARDLVSVSGTGGLHAVWDKTFGWRRSNGALSGDGRILAESTRCPGETAVERIDLTQLDDAQRAAFWSHLSDGELQ
jgi:hypothetical protein